MIIDRPRMATLTLLLGVAGVAGANPATGQILSADSLAIVQAVVTTRTHWIDGNLKFGSCSVYEHAGRPDDLGELFSPTALDRVQDPCRTRPELYPLAIIEGFDEAPDVVIVRVIANRNEHVHREAFHVRKRDAPESGWAVVEVRTSGFLRLHRPYRAPPP